MLSRRVSWKSTQFPEKNFLEHQSAQDGHKIATYRYPGKGSCKDNLPRAIIILFHGYGSYVGKFAYIAKQFAEHGYDVVGYDYPGFGLSEGPRGEIHNSEYFIQDGIEFITKLRTEYQTIYPKSNIPLVAIGYSQGAAAALGVQRFLQASEDTLDAVLLIAPNLGLAQPPTMTKEESEAMYKKFKDIAEHSPQTEALPYVPNPLEFLADYFNDELQYKGGVSAATLVNGLIDLPAENFQYASKYTLPIHISIGIEDQVCSIESIKEFYGQVGTAADKKQIVEYPAGHYLLSDGHVVKDVVENELDWLNQLFL